MKKFTLWFKGLKWYWKTLIVFVLLAAIVPRRDNSASSSETDSNSHTTSRNKGNEQPGEFIDYCPMCGKEATKSYLEAYGQITPGGHFSKGGPYVCHDCAETLKKNYYDGLSTQ